MKKIQLELERAEHTPPGAHPYYFMPDSKSTAPIESAAAAFLRTKGYATSQHGRRLISFIAIAALLSKGLRVRLFQDFLTLGVPFAEIIDLNIGQHCIKKPNPNSPEFNALKLSISKKLNCAKISHSTISHMLAHKLNEEGFFNWKSRNELVEKSDRIADHHKLSKLEKSSLRHAAFHAFPSAETRLNREPLGWPISKESFNHSLEDINQDKLIECLKMGLEKFNTPIGAPIEHSQKPTEREVLSYLLWSNVDKNTALQSFANLFFALSPERLSKFLYNDARRKVITSFSGFPDLLIWSNTEVNFVDVKGPGDRVQENQENFEDTVLKSIGHRLNICSVTEKGTSASQREDTASIQPLDDTLAQRMLDQLIHDVTTIKCKRPTIDWNAAKRKIGATSTSVAREGSIALAARFLEVSEDLYLQEGRLFPYRDKLVMYTFNAGRNTDFFEKCRWRVDLNHIHTPHYGLRQELWVLSETLGQTIRSCIIHSLEGYRTYQKICRKTSDKGELKRASLLGESVILLDMQLNRIEGELSKQLGRPIIKSSIVVPRMTGSDASKLIFQSQKLFNTNRISRLLKGDESQQLLVKFHSFVEDVICSENTATMFERLISEFMLIENIWEKDFHFSDEDNAKVHALIDHIELETFRYI